MIDWRRFMNSNSGCCTILIATDTATKYLCIFKPKRIFLMNKMFQYQFNLKMGKN